MDDAISGFVQPFIQQNSVGFQVGETACGDNPKRQMPLDEIQGAAVFAATGEAGLIIALSAWALY
jgi:hypothetical protein